MNTAEALIQAALHEEWDSWNAVTRLATADLMEEHAAHHAASVLRAGETASSAVIDRALGDGFILMIDSLRFLPQKDGDVQRVVMSRTGEVVSPIVEVLVHPQLDTAYRFVQSVVGQRFGFVLLIADGCSVSVQVRLLPTGGDLFRNDVVVHLMSPVLARREFRAKAVELLKALP